MKMKTNSPTSYPKPATEAFFAERKQRADPEAAIRFLIRTGGEPPRVDDELPN